MLGSTHVFTFLRDISDNEKKGKSRHIAERHRITYCKNVDIRYSSACVQHFYSTIEVCTVRYVKVNVSSGAALLRRMLTYRFSYRFWVTQQDTYCRGIDTLRSELSPNITNEENMHIIMQMMHKKL